MTTLKNLITSFGFTLIAVVLLLLAVGAVVTAIAGLIKLGVWIIPLIAFGMMWYMIHRDLGLAGMLK